MNFFSPAKINLHLKILEKRADGYHEIQSLMHRIDLADEMEIEPGGRGIEVATDGEEIRQENNLAWRAARIWAQAAGKNPSVRIRLKKKIPVGAGLGGGSSNAASALMALNEIYRTGLSREQLMALGVQIGADVPFFIFERPALARGIGEKLAPVEFAFPLWFLLAIPPFPISTPWAYGAYDRLEIPPEKPPDIAPAYARADDLRPVLQNDLERVAFARYPEMPGMKEALLGSGAWGALMSGSGSAMFGVFRNREEAETAQRTLPLPAGWKMMVSRGI